MTELTDSQRLMLEEIVRKNSCTGYHCMDCPLSRMRHGYHINKPLCSYDDAVTELIGGGAWETRKADAARFVLTGGSKSARVTDEDGEEDWLSMWKRVEKDWQQRQAEVLQRLRKD